MTDPRLAAIRDGLARAIETGAIAGAVWLVEERGARHVEAQGRRSFDDDTPMTADTLFHVASMTKPITAAAAMRLVEQGRIGLDDPLDPWLPELAHRRVLRSLASALDDTVPAGRPITLRDLLTCRMGLGLIVPMDGNTPIQQAMREARIEPGPDGAPFGPDELLRCLGALPLAAQPGERWLYHTSFDVLGALLARVAGRRLEPFLGQLLFEPLGMTDTHYTVPATDHRRRAGVYAADPQTGRLARRDAGNGHPSGSTGLQTTLEDYAAFGRMMLQGGRSGRLRVLQEATVQAMATDQISAEVKARSPFFPGFWDSHGWGLGMAVATSGAARGRFGWDGGFGTSWAALPGPGMQARQGMQAILLIQRLFDDQTLAILEGFWKEVTAAGVH